MLREALTGAAAGAVGTVAINAVTYADMAINGRLASDVPDTMAATLAQKVGLDFSAEGEDPDSETAQNRQSGLGALMGLRYRDWRRHGLRPDPTTSRRRLQTGRRRRPRPRRDSWQ